MRKTGISPMRNSKMIVFALLELMKTSRLCDISLIEIAEQAKVSKDTCYRHFNSKEEILWFFLQCEIDETLKRYDKLERKNEERFRTFFFLMFLKYKDATCRIYNNGMERLLYKAVDYYFREISFNAITPEHQYRRAGMVGVIFGVLVRWIERGMSEYPGDVAKICLELEPEDKEANDLGSAVRVKINRSFG